MSSVIKGAKKVFKKVGKVVKKVAPIVLAAAAIYFTAGAALGVAGAAGGWGAAAGALTSKIGLTGTLAKVVTGAVTQAGYGAVIGGVTSAVTGGDIAEGALYGAAGGAVTGGITGGLGINPDPLAAGGPAAGGSNLPVDPTFAPTGGPAAVSTAAAPAAAPSGPGFFDKGGWLERNQELAGGVISGVGKGLLTGMTARDGAEAQEDRDRRIAGNYALPAQNGLLRPASTRRASASPAFDFEYRFNPRSGQIEKVRM